MRVATLEGLAVLAVGVVVLNAVADALGEAAMACDGRSGAKVLLALARRRRVKALETQGRVAALLDAYVARLHVG
ncbi:hypothetical protein GOFOIKOB_0336 [Methylobacterium tardum]|jgi:hypothetical protein|uniref:Uncharacterized protein n=1 Tax=Methylobacterium tardum TaxID=374432 RepID=A0AA37TND9_9HYPH|nr:hypothetical protein GOFOIKOB_0336 [Methylobacterium tardum]GLS71313.1 hypothetical protein GCM10007890_33260 [Methylobacterium tardum]